MLYSTPVLYIKSTIMLLQGSLKRFFVNPKPVFTKQEMFVASLPANAVLPYEVAVRTKLCWRCDDRYYFDDRLQQQNSNLCVKCRICRVCGQSTRKTDRHHSDKRSRLCYLSEAARTCNCCADVWRSRPWCDCYRNCSDFMYPVRLYCNVDKTMLRGKKCAKCIYNEHCYDCDVNYTDLFGVKNVTVQNSAFTSVYSDMLTHNNSPTVRTLCPKCFKNELNIPRSGKILPRNEDFTDMSSLFL
jgi:hypothetical protein